MKDERGLYYFPNAADHRARMYVRRGEDGGVQFRLWQSDHPDVWDRHQGLDLRVIEDAARLYREERNAAIGGALKAGLLIGFTFLIAGAVAILAMQVLWA